MCVLATLVFIAVKSGVFVFFSVLVLWKINISFISHEAKYKATTLLGTRASDLRTPSSSLVSKIQSVGGNVRAWIPIWTSVRENRPENLLNSSHRNNRIVKEKTAPIFSFLEYAGRVVRLLRDP
jgi:hypothetical protein